MPNDRTSGGREIDSTKDVERLNAKNDRRSAKTGTPSISSSQQVRHYGDINYVVQENEALLEDSGKDAVQYRTMIRY